MRKQAELVNYRRRTERERLEQAERGRAAVLRELLPVVDDLDRAVNADTDNPEAYREGVELILRSLHEVLNRLGVEQIDPAGERFDPHLHEAVDHMPHEQTPAGHVVQVYKAGYRLGDRLLRPAMVSVSAGTDSGDEATDAPETPDEPNGTSAD